MPGFEWDKTREEAANLIARGELTIGAVADRLGIPVRSLYEWRKHPDFIARVDGLIDDMRAAIRRRAISWVERRVDRLNDAWLRMQQVIAERAADPALASVPGGKTGLLCRNVKGVGRGDDFQLIDVYEVDTGLLKELREHEKQAAQELGQWSEKTELSGPGGGPIPVEIEATIDQVYGDDRTGESDSG